MEHITYLNALNCTTLSPQKICHLLKLFHNAPKEIWHAPINKLKQNGLLHKSLDQFLAERTRINPEKEIERLHALSLTLAIHPKLTKNIQSADKERGIALAPYPRLLARIPIPPPLLYIKGTLADTQTIMRIAVVGSRKVTHYGSAITETLVRGLAKHNITIVSGLALGVDTIAHKIALQENAPTVAVLGNGLDTIYPPSNRSLAKNIIASSGALVSEFPPGVAPLHYHFPRRNRIISGLCHGTVVTEAAIKSGSLITAAHALDQNREVFAVPGNINQKNSAGTNSLIQRGAKLVRNTDDILEAFPMFQYDNESHSKPAPLFASPVEQMIYDQLKEQPLLVDELVAKMGSTASETHVALTLMEVRGIIKHREGGWYTIV